MLPLPGQIQESATGTFHMASDAAIGIQVDYRLRLLSMLLRIYPIRDLYLGSGVLAHVE